MNVLRLLKNKDMWEEVFLTVDNWFDYYYFYTSTPLEEFLKNCVVFVSKIFISVIVVLSVIVLFIWKIISRCIRGNIEE